ncbi:MAG: HD domain-containing protein [Treponema sp.]|nr:HD domain-containing protein [Treponema sp.]
MEQVGTVNSAYLVVLWVSVAVQLLAVLSFSAGRATEAKKYLTSALNGTLIYSLAEVLHYMGYTPQALSLGLKIQHVEALLLAVTLFITFCQVYNEDLKQPVNILLMVFLLIMFFPVFGARPEGKSVFGWFYADVSIEEVNGALFMDIGFNTYRIVYYGAVVLFLLFQLIVFIKATLIANYHHYKLRHRFFYNAFIVQILILCDLIFEWYKYSIPVVPAACMICAIICTISIARRKFSNLYDVSRFDVFNATGNPMFIIDNRFFVRYANKAAKVLFPEYKKLDDNTYQRVKACIELQNIITPPLHENLVLDESILRIGNQIYEHDLHRMGNAKNHLGYIITLYDVTERQEHNSFLEKQNIALTANLRAFRNNAVGMRDKLVSGALQFVSDRSPSTASHMQRTSNYTFVIALELRRLGYYADILTDSYMETLGQVAPIHDIGKALLPEEILKKTVYTDDEIKIIKSHTILGMQIVDRLIVNNNDDMFYKLAREVTYYHHEWWNGNGHPNGLMGEEIPLSARIIAVADVFDGISARHASRNKYHFDEACGIIEEYSGRRFDPYVVEAFKNANKKLKELYDQTFQILTKS